MRSESPDLIPIGLEDIVRGELLEERERSSCLAAAQQRAELEARLMALQAQALDELPRRVSDQGEARQ